MEERGSHYYNKSSRRRSRRRPAFTEGPKVASENQPNFAVLVVAGLAGMAGVCVLYMLRSM